VTTSNGLKRASQTIGDVWNSDSVPVLMLTLEQVKAAVNLSEDTLREVMRSGALPSVLVGRARRIRWTDLQNWVASLPRAAA
jgi:excisionase family DNA binding protein